ncbi:endoplasmic reticulum lectin 1 isoform X1 [Ostrinia nubilalis]|uniref:endoplasmic reticulum lectin 1 isoform X1 n=1 Tax=Ostrinia nubilalis TaxID=29057 RepID=UPI0030824571
MRCLYLLSVCAFGFVLCIENDFKGFDDTILFGINWPGAPEPVENLVDGEINKTQLKNNKEVLKVTTSNKERYDCYLPELKTKESGDTSEYDGPSPINLLKPLFAQKICSYRLESYWSYEVCHGRYIRQYHEEREGKQVRTQEYFLGHWSLEKQGNLEKEIQTMLDNKVPPKTTKVDGVNLPYVEMLLEKGTLCDLSGKPRITRVLYVCYIHGKHEVYSFKETATCEYEIIILSPYLCAHPQFKPKDVSELNIDCLPVGDSPKKPRRMINLELPNIEVSHEAFKLIDDDLGSKDVLAVLKVKKIEKDGETTLKFELHPMTEDDEGAQDSLKITQVEEKSHPVVTDDSPVRAFLNGENCLNGGTGWWKYEFCYGKHVEQYHIDRSGEKTSLLLGKFDEQAHLDWIKENKGKAPKPVEQRASVSHFYSNGDICDKTGKPRQTEVKLKCLENSSSPAQVSLYLLEPRTCHYILGVESSLICDILPLADENGLIKSPITNVTKDDAVVENEIDDDGDGKDDIVPKFGND